MLARPRRTSIARIVLALMLFAQAALAWSACQWPERSPARAVKAAADEAPCHEAEKGAVCVAHCLGDSQTVHKPAADVAAEPPQAGAAWVLPSEPFTQASRAFSSGLAPGTGPPRRIRFQSFQL